MGERFNPHWECLLREASTSRGKSRRFPLWNGERPLVEPEGWSKRRALAALAIRQVPFTGDPRLHDGMSGGREFSINPRALRPLHTLIHELGHISLGHTLKPHGQEHTEDPSLREFSADGIAYIFMHDQGVENQMDVPHVQYIMRDRLAGRTPSDGLKQRIFQATETIIEAGRLRTVR